MKKITLIVCIAFASLAHSQSLPFNFSAANQLMTGDACTTSLTTDAGNAVMQIVGGGQLYDNAQIVLSANVNLADNANNTITFRIKPTTGTGNGSHLLKFENGVGGPANAELAFTTVGTAWQDISIDFGAGLGNFSKMVIFTDFNNNATGTYLIDDIAGATNVVIAPAEVPAVAAPTPPARAAADVISLFSNAYADIAVTNWNQAPIWYAPTGKPVLDLMIAGNATKKVEFSTDGFIGVILSAYNNATTMTHFHMDYWIPNAANLTGAVLNPKWSNHANMLAESNALQLTHLPLTTHNSP